MVLGLLLAVMLVVLYGSSLIALQSVKSEVKFAPQKVYIEPRRRR